MAVRIVRLGSSREADEGLRIGTVRRPPRGLRKSEYAAKNIYDVWFPNLAPSEALLKQYFPITDDRQWRAFERRYRAEMKAAGETGSLVTMLCDGGERYLHSYYNHQWLAEGGFDLQPFSKRLRHFYASGELK